MEDIIQKQEGSLETGVVALFEQLQNNKVKVNPNTNQYHDLVNQLYKNGYDRIYSQGTPKTLSLFLKQNERGYSAVIDTNGEFTQRTLPDFNEVIDAHQKFAEPTRDVSWGCLLGYAIVGGIVGSFFSSGASEGMQAVSTLCFMQIGLFYPIGRAILRERELRNYIKSTTPQP